MTAPQSTICDVVVADLMAAQRVVVVNKWEPASGSRAAFALANPVERRGVNWRVAPVHTLHTLVSSSWVGMADHLRAAACLLPTDVSFGSMALARCAIEAAGRVAWVLDDELAIDKMIERSVAVRVRSLQDSVRVADLMAEHATAEHRPRLDTTQAEGSRRTGP